MLRLYRLLVAMKEAPVGPKLRIILAKFNKHVAGQKELLANYPLSIKITIAKHV
jgi:hypothetical protein